ncbi:4Fe-4S dicluster domain-containing protein [Edaphovirga cremea]|uniref:4Fe-4S dicluster domain-containing protein n=1 Tax=Edaphovirga cremea TaxID=2267246 RepID=UPI000DEFD0C0|nr:4Fe-4S dicluster domain-containing protein [Edaphovirga cremea]
MGNCSRRHFIAYMGSAIFITGSDARSEDIHVAQKSNTTRYGMLHYELRCIGCNACVTACKKTNVVPDGVSRLEIIRTVDVPASEGVKAIRQFFRKSCQHCENPPCVSVCPTGASYKDSQTGIVDINDKRCVGCRYCIAACPYQVRFINPVTNTADKCNFCRDSNLAEGKKPACVSACPTKALVFGNLDDPDSDIAKMIKANPVYRSKLHLGTEPKVYRIPGKYGEIQK